jgi:hypothetical protein
MATQKTPTEIRAIHSRLLDAFILRGRRIREHSLLSDLPAAKVYGAITWKMRLSTSGALESLSSPVPSEEALESLAARVRPLLLQTENISLYKVLKSVRFFAEAQGNPEHLEYLDSIKARFDGVASGRGGQYQVMMSDTSTGTDITLTNVELAEAWLYGDVVHADSTKHSDALQLGIQERYSAAVGVYMNTALVAHALLNLVQLLHKDDPSICSPSSITAPVTATIVDGHIHSMGMDAERSE